MTIPVIAALVGLIVWLIFSKTNAADPWAAEVGRLCFFAGLLAYLLSVPAGRLF